MRIDADRRASQPSTTHNTQNTAAAFVSAMSALSSAQKFHAADVGAAPEPSFSHRLSAKGSCLFAAL
ncbi:unnamed protein product [Toxocara canis]|uniref:Uncharacterized protein n=1 Tax=Toxocara canis TaxID=6265 RepID=A0A183UB85_TOXCA|nr:unnamed protein product [Toxocara canis]